MNRILRAIAARWALALPVMVGGAVLLSLLVLHLVEGSIAEDRIEELQDTANALAKRVAAMTIDGRLMGAETFIAATDPDVKRQALNQLPDNDPGVMRKLDQFRAIFHSQNAQLVAKNGRVASYSTDGKVSGTGNNVSWRPYFQRAIAGIPNVYAAVGTNTSERGLYFAMPISEDSKPSGETIGALVFKITLDEIDALLGTRATPALLLSPQGVVFAANSPELLFQLAGPATPERAAAIEKLRQFGNTFKDHPPVSLPFDPMADSASISALDLGIARASVNWGDPAGDWTLVVTEDSGQWLSMRRRIALLAGSTTLGGLLGLAVVLLLRTQGQRQAALDRLRLLSLAIEHSPVSVLITTASRAIEYVNPKLCQITGHSAAELDGADASVLRGDGDPADWSGEVMARRKDGETFWAQCHVAPMHGANGAITHYVTLIEDVSERKRLEQRVAERTIELEQTLGHLAAEKEEVERAMARLNEAHAELNKVNRRINESIRYASRIQTSLLPDGASLDGVLHDIAVGWTPRDVVGGDFYWIGRFGDRCLIAVIDCTGHGVPGAFMTAIVASVLDRILHEHCHDDPAMILQLLNRLVKASLHQEHHELAGDLGSDDGLDAAICMIDNTHDVLTFAGANIPLIYSRDGEMFEIKGNRHSLGYRTSRPDYAFTNHQLTLRPGDSFYLATDGVTDQVGGPNGRLFGRRRLMEALASGLTLPAQAQLERITGILDDYRAGESRRDDMTLLIFTPLAPAALLGKVG